MADDELRVNRKTGIPPQELRFTFSRAGGPGGQNVNKVNTKAELRFDLLDSPSLTPGQKDRARRRLASRLTRDGEIVIRCGKHRSQQQNRQACLERLAELLQKSLARPKPRKPTRPSRASREKRLRDKRKRAEKKDRRKRPEAE